MPNPYHDSHNGRFSTAQGASAAKDAIHDSGKSSGPESFKSGDRVRNAHRHNDYGTVDGLEAGGDVVVVKWDSGEWSQEDPTNLVTEVSARKQEAAQTLAQHVRAQRDTAAASEPKTDSTQHGSAAKDSKAVDQIHAELRKTQFSSDTYEAVKGIVRSTGRNTNPYSPDNATAAAPRSGSPKDTQALDKIHGELLKSQFSSDALEAVRGIVRSTGRNTDRFGR